MEFLKMTRISKKDRLKRCPRKPSYGSVKTGPKKDNLSEGYKHHDNMYKHSGSNTVFIPKIK